MGNSKDWFVDQLTRNILECIELTYRVSHHYADDAPQLSVAYDASHHTLTIRIGADERAISLKQRRRSTSGILDAFEDAKRAIHHTYALEGSEAPDETRLAQTQVICLKLIDLNRETSRLNASFDFQASDGVLTRTIKYNVPYIWRVIGKRHTMDIDYVTVVAAHHSGYAHLSPALSHKYVTSYIDGQLRHIDALLDEARRRARNKRSNHTDVSLLNCMKWQKET